MGKIYLVVVSGNPVGNLILHGEPWRNVSFGVNATDEEYAKHGLYPVEDTPPSYNQNTQKLASTGYQFDGTKITRQYVIQDLSAEGLSARLERRKEELAALRYQKECAGIIVNGQEIVTDRLSQAMLTGAFIACQIKPAREIDWKGAKGWSKLGAAHISAIASAVSDHVQACFTREKELSAALGADINTDITTGWPE